jgi:hypothetical protein
MSVCRLIESISVGNDLSSFRTGITREIRISALDSLSTACIKVAIAPEAGPQRGDCLGETAERKQSDRPEVAQVRNRKLIGRGPGYFTNIEFDLLEPESSEEISLPFHCREQDMIGRHLSGPASPNLSRQTNHGSEERRVGFERALGEQQAARLDQSKYLRHLPIQFRQVLYDIAQVEYVGARPVERPDAATAHNPDARSRFDAPGDIFL